MTENKRFMYYEHKGADYILDNPNTELDFIEMLGDSLEAEEIVDLLNKQDQLIKILSFDCEVFIKEIERMKFILKKKFDYDIEEVVAEIYDGKTEW